MYSEIYSSDIFMKFTLIELYFRNLIIIDLLIAWLFTNLKSMLGEFERGNMTINVTILHIKKYIKYFPL